MNGALEDWRQRGHLSLWRYNPMLRMYAGWHLTSDVDGCDSLLELLGSLASLGYPAHRTLALLDPTRVSADRIFGEHALKVHAPPKLRLSFDPSQIAPRGVIEETADRLSISIGPEGLDELRCAITDLRSGTADFSIGFDPDSDDEMTRVSFWWWPKGASPKAR
jgi:hypothetical protein